MATGPQAGTGWAGWPRRLAETALALVQVRLELFGSELEREKLRVFDALLRLALGLLLAGLTLVLAVGFVLLLLQEQYRLAALGVLVLAFAALAAWLLRGARMALRSEAGGPFALSLAELRRDRERSAATEPRAAAAAPAAAAAAANAANAAAGAPDRPTGSGA
ncbi:MAG: phage holin family protein [Rubrivivax sp.]